MLVNGTDGHPSCERQKRPYTKRDDAYWTGGGIQENRRNKCQRTDWKSDRLLPSTNHQKLAIIIATKLQKISSDANAHDYIYTYPDIEQDI